VITHCGVDHGNNRTQKKDWCRIPQHEADCPKAADLDGSAYLVKFYDCLKY